MRRRHYRPRRRSFAKANRRRKASSLEVLIHQWLDEDGIAYQKEKAIGRCHVDIFLEPNLCVELSGCWWHKCQCLEPEKGWGKTALAVHRKDLRRFAFLRSRGQDVIEIWECDVRDRPAKVRRMLRALAKAKKKVA